MSVGNVRERTRDIRVRKLRFKHYSSDVLRQKCTVLRISWKGKRRFIQKGKIKFNLESHGKVQVRRYEAWRLD